MPFVTIDLFEGRSQEQKIELAHEVTEVVSRIAKAPKEIFMSLSKTFQREAISYNFV